MIDAVAVVSLEPWDTTWRRNQHLAHQLILQRLADRILFLEPPASAPQTTVEVAEGITVIRPRLLAPRRVGGLAATAVALNARELKEIKVLWVNDATLGRHLLRRGRPTVYDVTDDWRSSTQHPRVRRRQVAAEKVLATRARTIVCSQTLHDLWLARYGVDAAVVANGADVAAIQKAQSRTLQGRGPHALYVGTLHRDRLDLELVKQTAAVVGTLHLVGPNLLDEPAQRQLKDVQNLYMHGPVPASDVPGWLVSADVLICPHSVTDFTLSLDAIKAHEYLATERPIVATPTSGFSDLNASEGVFVIPAGDFARAVVTALEVASRPAAGVCSWGDQAVQFAAQLRSATAV